MLFEIDADGFEAAEILFEHVIGRRLQDDLELLMLVEAVGIFAVAAVGGAAAGLHVRHFIRFGAEDAQEGFGRHGAGADFEIMRFLDDGATVGPVVLQLEDCVLKGVHRVFVQRALDWCGAGGAGCFCFCFGELFRFTSDGRSWPAYFLVGGPGGRCYGVWLIAGTEN